VVDCHDIFSQDSGTLASYIASRRDLKCSLITIVPSTANFKSDRFSLTRNQKWKTFLNNEKKNLYNEECFFSSKNTNP
jgi:hypothetical protein